MREDRPFIPEDEGRHVAECRKSIAECRWCSDHFGLVSLIQHRLREP